mmetsp:Transcript_14770/g.23097  ORF Transcript_14770/g.23097 Transcript_14770/m.23097 type:complete len:396 (-) Transcript_14770:225-1412(-)|eukprot:CAMPEP_0195297864 /NCGR_PEP_ID=MMETSP0707-20130614/22247_1 /TAXON_ID=33640 /ORGANISM="Asterionellopsis glacialis, Strain CCMP134" /LENGTH=395 /DNA_ID=CAMNT_0040359775 /DNA_START=308 /DNA_END=1495 /DNA_ORIENTATION=-
MEQATRDEEGRRGNRKTFPANRSEGNFSRYANPINSNTGSKGPSPFPGTIQENEPAKHSVKMRRSSELFDPSQTEQRGQELKKGSRSPAGVSKFPSKPDVGVKRAVSNPVRRSSSVEDVNAVQKSKFAMRRSRKQPPTANGRKPMQFFMRRYTDEGEQDLVKQQTEASKTRERQATSMKRASKGKSDEEPNVASGLSKKAEQHGSMTTVHEDFLLQCRNIESQARQLTNQDSDKQQTTEEIEKSMIRYSKGRRHHAGEALHRPHSEQELMQIASKNSGSYSSRLSGVDIRNDTSASGGSGGGNADWQISAPTRKPPSNNENPFLAKWRNPFSGAKNGDEGASSGQEHPQPPEMAGMPSSAARAGLSMAAMQPAPKASRSASMSGVSAKMSNMNFK